MIFGLHIVISSYASRNISRSIRGVWMRVFTDQVCKCNLISRWMPDIGWWSLKANLKQQQTCDLFRQAKCIGFHYDKVKPKLIWGYSHLVGWILFYGTSSSINLPGMNISGVCPGILFRFLLINAQWNVMYDVG